jgi:NDP-sugar pyrophosphorylase family protein
MWWDIGTPADYLNLHASLLKDARQVKHLIPVPRSQFFADRDVVLGKNLKLLDWGMIGAGARIGDEAQLERVVVWDGARVAKGAVHKDTIIY